MNFSFKDVNAIDDNKSKGEAYWKSKYEDAHKTVLEQKVEIDRLKHEVVKLKLAKEKSYAQQAGIEPIKIEL